MDGEGGNALEQIDLVQHDELWPRVEPRPVLGELAIDRPESHFEVRLRRVEHVHENLRALEVSEELVAEAGAVGRSLDEPWHVCDGELPLLRSVDHPEDRLEGRERVVGDLRLRVRDPPQERGLAGIREARERCIHHELEPELDLELLAREARLGESRRLTGRRREAGNFRVRPGRRAPRRRARSRW